MKTLHETIVAMRNDSSKTAKIALLSEQKGSEFAKEYLRLMYEPRVNFYVSKVEPALADSAVPIKFDMQVLDALKNNICNRKVTGGEARRAIANIYASLQSEADKELLTLLIERDAKSGFGASTINKVWGDLITDIPYMRCCLPKDAKLDKFNWQLGVFSQLKCDGMFANVTHTKAGCVTVASRSGSPFPIEMFSKLVADVKAKIPGGNQLHGELLMYKDGVVLERQLSNGMFNSIQQGGELEPGYDIVFVAWDIIPESEAKAKNKYKVPYRNRFVSLCNALGYKDVNVPMNDGVTPLQAVATKIVGSFAESQKHYKEMLALGYEGTIIKEPTMIWEDTTSKWQVKMKLVFECDLRITGFNPGKGKNAATFGSIIGESACGKLVVGISGFPDKLRKQLWADHVQLVNKIMTVKANGIMDPTKPGGVASLFLPRFEEIRLDKKTADTFVRIQEQAEAAIESVA